MDKLNMEIKALIPSYGKDFPLDPATLIYTVQYHYLQNLSVNLVEIDKDEDYVLQLAKSISKNKSNNEFKITLKEAYFSNGDQITATDVAMSIKRAILKGTPHFDGRDLFQGSEKLGALHDDISGVEVLNKLELMIRINHSQKELFYYLQLTDLSILHSSQYLLEREILAKDWQSVTSGPYHLKFDDERVFLVANPKSLNYSAEMPQSVEFVRNSNTDEIKKIILEGQIHIGELTSYEYIQMSKEFADVRGLDIFTSKTDSINILSLNTKNGPFAVKGNREWFLKRVIDQFQVPTDYKMVMEKAYQFFLPGTLGYIPEKEILSSISTINDQGIPDGLEKGIVIKTIEGMRPFIMPDFSKHLAKAVGIPFQIDSTTKNTQQSELLSSGDYDAYLIGISMSYKVLGETLNFQYLSKIPLFKDPSGKIKNLLKEYQKLEDTGEEYRVIRKIIKQMIDDAECIPLHYSGKPTFVLSRDIDISDLYLDEAIQFWRIRAP